MKKKLIIIVIAVVALLAIIGTSVAAKKRDGNLTEVTVAKAERADLTSKVTASGKIEAQRKVDLSSHVMGQIVNLAVREGDAVKKGDFLLQIDKAQLAANTASSAAAVQALLSDRDAARANLTEAQRNYERAQKNYSEKIIPAAELDRARAAIDAATANVASADRRIEQAKASLQGAQDTLSKTTIHAPMSGLVTRLPVEEGEVAVIGTMNNPGTVLLTISDMSVVEAVIEVDETDMPAVKLGQKAKVTIDAYPNKTFDGVVTEAGSSPISRGGVASGNEAIKFEVKIQVTNPPEGVRPGFSCAADIITGSRPKALAIPIQALVVREKEGTKKEEEGVYTLDKELKVKFVPVKTGITGETQIELASGLAEGTQIVTGPFRALREIKDGQKVRIAKEKTDKEKEKDKVSS
ncbi:MAG TPA: efflux RND transporter periplasmic adaptor subunit [Thermoanaerobaculia bacterium]|nr:efflux RND transporter periplasmic adaptor subunit [Thermoanaerobaculia bacterium]